MKISYVSAMDSSHIHTPCPPPTPHFHMHASSPFFKKISLWIQLVLPIETRGHDAQPLTEASTTRVHIPWKTWTQSHQYLPTTHSSSARVESTGSFHKDTWIYASLILYRSRVDLQVYWGYIITTFLQVQKTLF